ncbi:hypothetical protein [Rosenbergiella collisarenosi]|uniref:hypothetical protein n=1 Tax=Rosenbergiella collisarenosi TaxID=1544695 RepID=UPI001F4F8594|nr:hypothetical protein [Rosenbergiella collisarenosi]
MVSAYNRTNSSDLLNNSNFQFLAVWINIIYIALMVVAPMYSAIIFSVMTVWSFINDRKFLKAHHAFVPHWWWYFLLPVYIFKRQHNNNLGLLWFWLYWVSVLMAVFVMIFLDVKLP